MLKGLTVYGALLIGLAAHVWLAVAGSDRIGTTADEPVHIVSGLYYNLAADYRFQPENGLLPQRLEALPWVLAGVDPPARSGTAWEQADIWALGETLFQNQDQRVATLLARSRLVSALAGAALLLLIYRWSRSLCGRPGALVVLALAAFCPNLLAHAGLATSDVLGTLGLVAATLAWWRLCHRVNPVNTLLAGGAAGLLALCKFTCVLLAPVAALLLLLRLLRSSPLPWSCGLWSGRLTGFKRLAALLPATAAVLGIAVVVIWTGYGFRYQAASDSTGRFMKSWDTILMVEPQDIGLPQLGEPESAQIHRVEAGPVQKAIGLARDHRLLPEAWLYGFGFVAYHSHHRLAYFAGDYRTSGWWSFFPAALLLKTTLPGLAAIALGAGTLLAARRRTRLLYRLGPCVVLGAIILGFSMAGGINIGLRHVLPVIVCLWVFAGAAALATNGPGRRLRLAALGLCAAAQAGITLHAAPHFLAYFNPLGGNRPDRWLVDSNLDWGQGLPELRRWQQARPDQPAVFLSYFGSDLTSRHHLNVVRFADHHFDRSPRQLPAPLTGGWYALGATQYRRAYSQTRGPWTPQRELLYQDLLRRIHAEDWPPAPGAREAMLLDFDCLRLARLTHFLEGRPADETLAGGAMLLFRLGDAEAATAFYAPLREVNAAVIRRLEAGATSATTSP